MGLLHATALLIMNDHKKEKQSKNNKAETVTGVLNCSGSWALAKGSFLTVRELHLVMHWSDENKWVGPIEGWEKRGRRDAPWLVSVASKWCWLVCLWNWFLSRVIEAETKFSGMQPFPCVLFKEKKKCGGGFCDGGNGTEKKLIGRRAKSENGKYKNSSQAPDSWVPLSLQHLNSLTLSVPCPLWEPGEGSSPWLWAEGGEDKTEENFPGAVRPEKTRAHTGYSYVDFKAAIFSPWTFVCVTIKLRVGTITLFLEVLWRKY